MSTINSNLKQSRLDFSVGKRTTTSNNKNGKPSQTPPIPVEVTKKKPSGKTETVDTDGYEDFILPSSDEEKEDSEDALSPDIFKPTGKKDAPNPAGRATRASAKHIAKKTPKEKEEASDELEKPKVPRASKANIQPEATVTKKAAAGAAPTESKETLPELKIKDSKWTKHYVEVKNKMGLPPIHGETQNRIHEILRVFDNSYEYGPCVGVTRLERWNRANALGLNPPKEVKEILNTKQGSTMPEYSQSVFYGEV